MTIQEKYVPRGLSLQELVEADTLNLGQIIRHALEVEIADYEKSFKSNPKVGTEKVRDDLRYKLGRVDGLEFYAQLIEKAQLEASKQPRG